MSNSLVISASGDNATTAGIKLSLSASANHNHAAQFFAPNLTNGEVVQIYFGKETGPKKTASIGYKYYSDGSDSNLITLSMWGANDLSLIHI